MRDYGKIAPQFWTGETGKAIRAAGPQVQVVALYLLTSPSSTMIGLYYLPLPTLCHEVGCSLQAAQEALQVLSQVDFAHYDERTEFVWVPNMARFQIGECLKKPEDKKSGDKRIPYLNKVVGGLKNIPFLNDFMKRYQEVFCLDGISPIDVPSVPLRSPSDAKIKSIHKNRKAESRKRDLSPTVDLEFEEAWNLYPMRNGKRVGKPEALAKFRQLNPEDRFLVLAAVRNYASSEMVQKGFGIKDCHRWLQNGKDSEPWRDWVEPENKQAGKEQHDGRTKLPRVGFEERDYRQGTF